LKLSAGWRGRLAVCWFGVFFGWLWSYAEVHKSSSVLAKCLAEGRSHRVVLAVAGLGVEELHN